MITPLDIENKKFSKKTFNGYDPEEVDIFLDDLTKHSIELIMKNILFFLNQKFNYKIKMLISKSKFNQQNDDKVSLDKIENLINIDFAHIKNNKLIVEIKSHREGHK